MPASRASESSSRGILGGDGGGRVGGCDGGGGEGGGGEGASNAFPSMATAVTSFTSTPNADDKSVALMVVSEKTIELALAISDVAIRPETTTLPELSHKLMLRGVL